MKYNSGQYRMLFFDDNDNLLYISPVLEGYMVGFLKHGHDIEGFRLPNISYSKYEVVYLECMGKGSISNMRE